jgi:hypothetical protein
LSQSISSGAFSHRSGGGATEEDDSTDAELFTTVFTLDEEATDASEDSGISVVSGLAAAVSASAGWNAELSRYTIGIGEGIGFFTTCFSTCFSETAFFVDVAGSSCLHEITPPAIARSDPHRTNFFNFSTRKIYAFL